MNTHEHTAPGMQALNLDEVARNAGELPALPGIATTALNLIDDPRASARDIQFVIAKDQALTARILKIVNSVMYCFQREVSTLSHAIAILGTETVRSVIVAACMQQALQAGPAGSGQDLTTQLFWKHSWGAAVAAKAIAISTQYPVSEEAFTCGLLHDMGKMVMLKNRRDLYSEILNDAYRGETDFYQAELRVFGFTHVYIGALLVSKWRFPTQLIEGILYHHDFAASPNHRRLAAIAALADRMMALLEVGFIKDASLKLEEESSAEFLKLSEPVLRSMTADIRTMILTLPGGAKS